MLLMADLHHLPSARAGADRRTPGALRPRRGREEARLHLLRRHEAPPRPRHDPGRQPADHLPRRADHRPRPAQPPHMWEIIRELVADGVTVFLTTQYLEEADQLADRIAVLNDGKIAAEGTAEELKRLIPGGHDPAPLHRPGRLPAAAAALRDGDPRRRGAHPADPQRRQPARTARHPRPARLRRHRGRRADRAHPRPRRRLLRPDRQPPAVTDADQKETVR